MQLFKSWTKKIFTTYLTGPVLRIQMPRTSRKKRPLGPMGLQIKLYKLEFCFSNVKVWIISYLEEQTYLQITRWSSEFSWCVLWWCVSCVEKQGHTLELEGLQLKLQNKNHIKNFILFKVMKYKKLL